MVDHYLPHYDDPEVLVLEENKKCNTFHSDGPKDLSSAATYDKTHHDKSKNEYSNYQYRKEINNLPHEPYRNLPNCMFLTICSNNYPFIYLVEIL